MIGKGVNRDAAEILRVGSQAVKYAQKPGPMAGNSFSSRSRNPAVHGR